MAIAAASGGHPSAARFISLTFQSSNGEATHWPSGLARLGAGRESGSNRVVMLACSGRSCRRSRFEQIPGPGLTNESTVAQEPQTRFCD